MRLLFAVLVSVATVSSPAGETSWPQFRGPQGNGHARAANVPIEFSEDVSVSWKTEMPGKGWSSPVVVSDVIWMTTAIEQKPTDQERERLLDASLQGGETRSSRAIAKSIHLKLVSVDFNTGSILKTIDLATIENPDAIHTLNSYSSPTPMIDGDQIHCHFGTFGTFCVDLKSGEIVWSRQLPMIHSVGPGSSPLVCGDLLVLIQDGVERQYVTALDKKTGDTVWEVERPELDISDGQSKKSFCTPITVTDKRGRQQLICVGAHWVIAYHPETGKVIWKCNHGKGFSIVPRPVCDGESVYFTTGYGKPTMLSVRIDGDGDVSDTHIQWRLKKGIPAKPSPILLEGLIYVIDDMGVASCIEASSGDIVWKKRIGGNYSSSPILAGGHIYFCSQDGKVTVIQPGREYQFVAENQIDDRIMASPAIVGNSIVLRTEKAIYRIE